MYLGDEYVSVSVEKYRGIRFLVANELSDAFKRSYFRFSRKEQMTFTEFCAAISQNSI